MPVETLFFKIHLFMHLCVIQMGICTPEEGIRVQWDYSHRWLGATYNRVGAENWIQDLWKSSQSS